MGLTTSIASTWRRLIPSPSWRDPDQDLDVAPVAVPAPAEQVEERVALGVAGAGGYDREAELGLAEPGLALAQRAVLPREPERRVLAEALRRLLGALPLLLLLEPLGEGDPKKDAKPGGR